MLAGGPPGPPARTWSCPAGAPAREHASMGPIPRGSTIRLRPSAVDGTRPMCAEDATAAVDSQEKGQGRLRRPRRPVDLNEPFKRFLLRGRREPGLLLASLTSSSTLTVLKRRGCAMHMLHGSTLGTIATRAGRRRDLDGRTGPAAPPPFVRRRGRATRAPPGVASAPMLVGGRQRLGGHRQD